MVVINTMNYYTKEWSDNGQATSIDEPTSAGEERFSSGDHVSGDGDAV